MIAKLVPSRFRRSRSDGNVPTGHTGLVTEVPREDLRGVAISVRGRQSLVLPGDKPLRRPAGQNIEPAEISELRELLRRRYALDMKIWSQRDSYTAKRPFTQREMLEADAILAKIKLILACMDKESLFETTAQYKKFKEIKRRVEETGKRNWTKEPPWKPSS
jgi:hypothetical protein